MTKYTNTCPKCGSNDLYTRFRRASERLDDGFNDPRTTAEEDCLRSHFHNCRYRWSDFPCDAPSSEDQQESNSKFVDAQSFEASVLMFGFLCGFWYDPQNKLYRASDESWWRREGLELVPGLPPEGWSKTIS